MVVYQVHSYSKALEHSDPRFVIDTFTFNCKRMNISLLVNKTTNRLKHYHLYLCLGMNTYKMT